jgi:hypothetical protein
VSKQISAALAAPFEEKDLKHRPGRAGMTFTYADARAVAQRLDDVLGLTGWEFEVAVADAARGVVKGTLHIVVDGKTVIHEDFGYPNSTQDDEPLKSAASDALRRCAAQIGVGRSLYSPERGQALARAAAPVSVAPAPKSEGFTGATDDQILAAKAAMLFAQSATEDACSHGEEWRLKPGGISKTTGKPYNEFWAASHKAPDGSWCKEKPSIKWIAGKSAPAPKLVPEDSLDEIPF